MKKLFILSVLALSFTACKKEKYNGYQSFWYDQQTANDLFLDGVSTLSLYVDGSLIGTVDASEYYESTPACKDGHFVYTDKMYRNESSDHTYKIIDETNYTLWEGNFSTDESQCSSIQLTY